MLTNPRAQAILLFLAIAFVYTLSHQGTFIFYAEWHPLVADKPHPFLEIKAAFSPPNRLIDIFISPLWQSFYHNLIYPLYQPFTGELHFVDVHLHAVNLAWGLVFAGFCWISILWVRLFVPLNRWQMGVYALLFFSFYVSHDIVPFSYVRLMAYNTTLLTGLCFLYPVGAYLLKKKNVLQEWNEGVAIGVMATLCYFSYVSIMFDVVFAGIALACLWGLHFAQYYQWADFSSRHHLWKKLKTAPRWLLVVSALAPVLSLLAAGVASAGTRLEGLNSKKTSWGEREEGMKEFLQSLLSDKFDYDGRQLIFFAAVVVLSLGLFFYQKRQQGAPVNMKPFAFLFLGIGLFIIFALWAGLNLHSRYTNAMIPKVRFIFVTIIFGAAFWLSRHKVFMPLMTFAFVLYSLTALYALSNPSVKLKSRALLANADMKLGVNLGYTFSCYGESHVPIHRSYLINDWVFLPDSKGHPFWGWNKILDRFTARRGDISIWKAVYKAHVPNVFYYHEPSVKKINAQLAELRKTKTWLCAHLENNIYRIEKLGY